MASSSADALIAWLKTAKPRRVRGKFTWGFGDDRSVPAPDQLPADLIWSGHLTGFPLTYDTWEGAMVELADRVDLYVRMCRERT